MNRQALALLLLICLGHASVSYTAEIDRRGHAVVTVSVEDGEEAYIPFPDDSYQIVLVGGSYNEENGTVHLSPGSTGFSTFSFSSEMLTVKSGAGWKALLSPPEGAPVTVYMPPYSTIGQTAPKPAHVASEDSRTMLEFEPASSIVIEYELEDFASSGGEGDAFSIIVLLGGAMILGAILRDMYGRLGRRPASSHPKPSLEMTAGKREMMETFNENDKKVVRCLLESKGKAKRNALERTSGISKSSLAVSLNRLEKRKMIDIDRTSTTHFVKLSERFLGL